MPTGVKLYADLDGGVIKENGSSVLTESEYSTQMLGWKDMSSVIQVNAGSGNAPLWSQIGSTPFYGYAFALDKECWTNFHINHDYKPGGQLFLHVHWLTNGTNTDTVKWQFNYAIAKGFNQSSASDFPFASSPYYTGQVVIDQAGSGSPWRHMTTEIATSLTTTNAEVDAMVMCHLKRVANGGTDNTDTVFVVAVDCHYQTDRHTTTNKSPNFYG